MTTRLWTVVLAVVGIVGLMASAGLAAAATINVPADYASIQEAVDAASGGDEILVGPGTYTSTQDGHVVDMQGKAITLRSTGGAAVTIIDGEGARRGIACFSGETADTAIEGFTITGGSSGGIYCNQSSPTITGCTITDNTSSGADGSDGGIYSTANSNPTLTDTIVCGNSGDQIYGPWTDGGWTLIWDACEDCNGNGVDDADDILSGTSFDVDQDGIPDECECDCDGDGVTDPLEILNGTQQDIDGNGHPDECEDCDGDGIPDEVAIAQGWVPDCNGNLLPDSCDIESGVETDCNGNGFLDSCEFEDDPSTDCNTDGVLDACQLDDPLLNCNSNNTLDSCEIADGTVDDIDGDGIPDECDCLADLDGDGFVATDDLLLVISQFGLKGGSADLDYDGVVGVGDLLTLISTWGPCP